MMYGYIYDIEADWLLSQRKPDTIPWSIVVFERLVMIMGLLGSVGDVHTYIKRVDIWCGH